jgi:predicted DNA-binding protein (MmcQ/YjbR family)
VKHEEKGVDTMTQLAHGVTPWPQDMTEHYRWLDALLLKKPATEKVFQPAWQAYRYLLRGKMYAYIGVNDQNKRPILTLKLEPAYSDLLRREYADVVPGYYMNKLHWSTVYLDGAVPQDAIATMARASHGVMLASLSKKAQREISEHSIE